MQNPAWLSCNFSFSSSDLSLLLSQPRPPRVPRAIVRGANVLPTNQQTDDRPNRWTKPSSNGGYFSLLHRQLNFNFGYPWSHSPSADNSLKHSSYTMFLKPRAPVPAAYFACQTHCLHLSFINSPVARKMSSYNVLLYGDIFLATGL